MVLNQTNGIKLTKNIIPAVIKPALGIIEGISRNHGPCPGCACLPLITKVTRTPSMIEAIQNAKNTEAIEARITSISSSGLLLHEESSKVYRVAKEIARWKPITIDSKIEDSSFQLFLYRKRVNTNTKAKVKLSIGVIGVNSGAKIDKIIAAKELRIIWESLFENWSTTILPINAAKAAITGRIRISAYPSFSIPPLAT